MTSVADDVVDVDTPILNLSTTTNLPSLLPIPSSPSPSPSPSPVPQSPSLVLDKIPILAPPKRIRRAETISLPSTPRYKRTGGGRNSVSGIATPISTASLASSLQLSTLQPLASSALASESSLLTSTPISTKPTGIDYSPRLQPPKELKLVTDSPFVIKSIYPNLETDSLDTSSDMSDFSINAFEKPMNLSPHSFLFGILVGVILVFLKPTFEFYMEIGARITLVVLKYSLFWGSMGLIVYGLIKFLIQGNTVGGIMNTTATTPATSTTSTTISAPSSSVSPTSSTSSAQFSNFSPQTSPILKPSLYKSHSSSPTRIRRKYSDDSLTSNSSANSSSSYATSTNSIDEKYSAYKPYTSHTSRYKSSHDLEIISGEDISVLEKPIGQNAFRLPRKNYGAHLTVY